MRAPSTREGQLKEGSNSIAAPRSSSARGRPSGRGARERVQQRPGDARIGRAFVFSPAYAEHSLRLYPRSFEGRYVVHHWRYRPARRSFMHAVIYSRCAALRGVCIAEKSFQPPTPEKRVFTSAFIPQRTKERSLPVHVC